MGGCRCTFRNCENSTATRPGMHFFHYPIRDADRLKQWVDIAEKQDFLNLEMDKLKNKVVCEEHFEERCFMNIKHERLIKTAVPSIIRSTDGEMLEVSTEDLSQYEILTIEPLENGHVTPSSNEPILLNNRKRPLVLNDFKNRPDNFVVDLNLEGLQNGDLTISFEEQPGHVPSPSLIQPPTKQKRRSFYPSVTEVRKENRILNSSLNLNTKLSEPVVLNSTSLIEMQKKSPISVKAQSKVVEKQLSMVSKQDAIISNVQNVRDYEVIDLNAQQPKSLDAITDAIQSTVKSLNILDKHCYEAKCTEQAGHVNDMKQMLANIISKQDEVVNELKTTKESINQITTNQTVQFDILSSKQLQTIGTSPATGSCIKVENITTTTSGVKSKFNQNKIQLFNRIKKYLNPAMVALLRLELFGSSERECKSDEKSISVELLNLGASTYDYLRDEWRFRLPPKKDVAKWTNENLDDEEENSDVN